MVTYNPCKQDQEINDKPFNHKIVIKMKVLIKH